MAHLPRASILQRNWGEEAEKFEQEKQLEIARWPRIQAGDPGSFRVSRHAES
jgi:hypothetical protein